MIIFDVGANDGKSCCHFANDVNNTVYAFEPTPQLVEAHLRKYSQKNYVIIQKAVTNFNGTAKFNIAGQSDWGCSSLYEFNDNLDKTWPGRWDFVKTAVIDVECITMKAFIEQNNISIVDFLHCDTQGNDLLVLQSFEEHIDKLVSGEIEVFVQNPLYKGINNSRNECVKFLEINGFKITAEQCNDAYGNEWNIHFSRK